MQIKRLISLIIIIIFCSISLSGCYSAQGLETLAYAVAIGIDKGDNDKLKLSFQFAILGNSSSSGGGSSQSQESTVTSVDCASIDSGISLVDNYISKKVNLSHCKAIIISEELAYEGVSEYIFTLVNDLEMRPDCNIIISRCDASDYLENSKPTLESVSARYYELTLNSSEYTGFTEDVTLSDFYSDMLSTTTQPHAILGGINTSSENSSNNDIAPYDLQGSYKAGETPIKSETVLENMGLAVFNHDRLVGELNGMESLCHLLIVNKFKSATISIPSPFNSEAIINLYLTTPKDTESSVELINGTPYITCNVFVTGNITSLDENLDYSTEENLKLIEDYTNSYLEQNILSYLYKTSKEYKCDIANFGRHVIGNYLTWNDWIESDWLYNYQNSFFSVNVNSNIRNR